MSLFRRMETRRLQNKEMQSLVHILRGVPFPCTQNDQDRYNKITKKEIRALPLKLRSLRPISTKGLRLCNTHAGFDHHLIKDIWSWMRHELEGGIGRLLYPLIMGKALTPDEELSVRQLEPVLEMWRADFNKDLAAPPGRAPIETANKWQTQHDACAACMLSRIGSDKNVLFALMAGMAGRLHRNSRKNHGYENMNQFRAVTHKRIRFVRYWLMTYRFGERKAWEAWKFGREMKKLRKEWKDGLFAEFPKDGYDFNKPLDRSGWSTEDFKLGPQPRPVDVDPTTPGELVGLKVPGWRDDVVLHTPSNSESQAHRSLRGSIDRVSTSTFSRNDSVHDRQQPSHHHHNNNTMLAPPPHTPRSNPFRPSSSIYSRPSGFGNPVTRHSLNNTYTYDPRSPANTHKRPPNEPPPPPSNPFSDPKPHSSNSPYYHPHPPPPPPHLRISRNPYAIPIPIQAPSPPPKSPHRTPRLPPPRPQSLYSAYADPSFDDEAFADVDISPPMTPSRESWDRERDRVMGFGLRGGGGDEDKGMEKEAESEGTTWGDFCDV